MKYFLLIFFYLLLLPQAQAMGLETLIAKQMQSESKGHSCGYIVVLNSTDFIKRKSFYLEVFKKHPQVKLSFVMTEVEELPEYSTGDIVKAVRESLESIHIVAEKKAAADVLESLLQYPKLSEKIISFTSYQGLVRGAYDSEAAIPPLDLVEGERAQKIPLVLAFRILTDLFISLMHGFDRVLYSFKPIVREKYLKKNEQKIKGLSKKIKLISIEPGQKNYGLLPFSKLYK